MLEYASAVMVMWSRPLCYCCLHWHEYQTKMLNPVLNSYRIIVNLPCMSDFILITHENSEGILLLGDWVRYLLRPFSPYMS